MSSIVHISPKGADDKLKLLVLVKEIVDTNSVDVEEDEYLTKDVDSDDIIMNPDDKHAIEAALQLQENNEDYSVHVLCLGPKNALKVLREAIAMGVEGATRIEAEDLGYLSSYAKSDILAKAIKHLGEYDIVLTGMYSADFGQAQVPVLLASNLGYPQITYVETIKIEDNAIIGDRYVEGGKIMVKVSKPCVVSIASTANEPRYTSVKRILKAKKTEIPTISLDDIGIDEDSLPNIGGLELLEVEEPDEEELEVFKVEEDDLEQAVETLVNKLKEDGIDLGAYK
jgi:electron transfer flavoprotein beta subunit